MFPDRDRCPFYGCVCWPSSCSDGERQEGERKKGGRRQALGRMEEKLETREAGK